MVSDFFKGQSWPAAILAIRKSLYLRDTWRMIGLAILIGLLGGVVAIAFHRVMELITDWFLHDLGGFTYSGIRGGIIPRWLFFVIPAIGGLVSGWLVFTFAPEAEGAGTDSMIDSFHNKGGNVRARVPLIKMVSSIFTIGTGGSAGQEGPVAQVGSGVGSLVGQILKFPVKMRRLLLLTGTAAGLGAIFRAPLGGALTAVEVIYKEDFESEGFMPCILASVVAYATFNFASGEHGPFFVVDPEIFRFTNPIELVFYALLGAACAPVSWAFVKSFYWTRDKVFRKINIKAWLRPALGGLIVGLIAYLHPGALGAGWGMLHKAVQPPQSEIPYGEKRLSHVPHDASPQEAPLVKVDLDQPRHGWPNTLPTPMGLALGTMLIVMFLKILTTSITIGSGGSGGVFGPSLFIGGMLGGALGTVFENLFPAQVDTPQAFVIVGMGAFFAGAAKAPIAGVIMACELTGNYGLLAPLLIAATIHIALSRKWSLYENQKENKFASPAHKSELITDVLQDVRVADVLERNQNFITLSPTERLADIHHLLKDSEDEAFPVINDEGKLVGLVVVNHLRKVILEKFTGQWMIVDDLRIDPIKLRPNQDLHSALQFFLRSKIGQLPVVDRDGKILGMFSHENLLAAYDQYISGSLRASSTILK